MIVLVGGSTNAAVTYLTDRPTAYLDEMQWFLFDEHNLCCWMCQTFGRHGIDCSGLARWSKELRAQRCEDTRAVFWGRLVHWSSSLWMTLLPMSVLDTGSMAGLCWNSPDRRYTLEEVRMVQYLSLCLLSTPGMKRLNH